MNTIGEAPKHVRGTQWLKDFKDLDHPAFTYGSQLDLAEIISNFVDRGLNQNEINVFFIETKHMERYLGYLKESGFEADKLLASGDIVIKPVDELLEKAQVNEVTGQVKEWLQAISELARKKGKRGAST